MWVYSSVEFLDFRVLVTRYLKGKSHPLVTKFHECSNVIHQTLY